MNITKRFTLSLSALLLVSGTAMTMPVSAIYDSDGSQEKTTNSVSQTEDKAKVENQARDLAEKFRTQARTKIAEDRAKVRQQTQKERQTACESRKTNLTKRMANAVARAQKHKAVFDKIYVRLQNFHDTKNLDVANYETLIANANTAQAEAAASISALEALNVTLDCASETVAESVGVFQQAVKNTRDSLKNYRSALVELTTALKGASTSTNDQTSQ